MNKNLKRWISIASALMFAISAYAYTDVPDTDPDFEVINFITDLGVLDGYADGSFRPDEIITRAELAKIIVNAMDYVLMPDENVYNDILKDYWATPWINAGFYNGIIFMDGDKCFHPDEYVTYEQAVKTIIATLGYDGDLKTRFVYPDSYISSAKELGIIDDTSGTVGEFCTRRQFVKMLYNSLEVPMYSYCGQGPIKGRTMMYLLTNWRDE